MTTTFSNIYRWLLAVVGGFGFTIVTCGFIPLFFKTVLGWHQASSLMVMMLLSFALYCTLIIQIIATRHLKRTSLLLFATSALMIAGTLILQG